MRPSPEHAPLPTGLTEEKILGLLAAYAPRVRLSRHERHLPSDPETFRRQSALRWSRRFWKDRGWDKELGDWVAGDPRGPRFRDVGWPEILAAQYPRLPDGHPASPDQPNDRPRDPNNRHGGPNGLFLERGESFATGSSGPRPVDGRVTAPVFVDVAYSPDAPVFKVLLWFFYELNWTDVFGVRKMLTHEGDWEHVTLVFDVDAPDRPHTIYFAQHNGGAVVPFGTLLFEPGSGDHPTIYANPEGHPTEFAVTRPQEYDVVWDTWTCPLRLVAKEPWRDFGGAWGEVGNLVHTTGPLGPLYKRHRDHLRVTITADGRLAQVLKKS